MTEKKHKNGLFEITVKAVVVKDGDKVLILKRPVDDYHGAGNYDLPGGSLDANEHMREALQREVREETGIEVEVGPIVHIVDAILKRDDTSVCRKGIRFIAYHKDKEVDLSEEHDQFEWMPIDEAIEKLSSEGFEKDKREALVKAKEYLAFSRAMDNWKQTVADFENYKKRQMELQKDLIKRAYEGVTLQVLPVLDNFHASMAHIPEDQKNGSWVQGITHIQRQMADVLRDMGVEEFYPNTGEEFNPSLHEAIEKHDKENKEEFKNKITKVIQKGYKIGERVIRPARVIVE